MFIAILFTIAKLQKQPRCPNTGEWIKKMWYLYTTVSFYLFFDGTGVLTQVLVIAKQVFYCGSQNSSPTNSFMSRLQAIIQ
jgi:hypothetical protein